MSARAAKAARYLQILKLKDERKTIREIAEATGYSERQVYRILFDAECEFVDRFGHRAA